MTYVLWLSCQWELTTIWQDIGTFRWRLTRTFEYVQTVVDTLTEAQLLYTSILFLK